MPNAVEVFGPRIDQLVDFLAAFGEGTYVSAAEKELWEPPFDVNLLPQLHTELVHAVSALSADGATANSVVTDLFSAITALNEQSTIGPLVEEEEWEDIIAVLRDVLQFNGVTDQGNQLATWDDLELRAAQEESES